MADRLVECLLHIGCRDVMLHAMFLPGNPLPPHLRMAVDWLVWVINDAP